MSKQERLKCMALNALVRHDKFEWADPDNCIFASMSQPPIRVLDKHDTDDELKWTVECPNCKRAVIYGDEIFMVSGHLYCSDENCKEQVYKELGLQFFRKEKK